MTIEEAIKTFKGRKALAFADGYADQVQDCIEAMSMAIAALRAQQERENQKPQWISVKDRLPEKLEPVNIVWVNRKPERYYAEIEDKPFVATGYYWNDKWWWYSATCEDYLAEYGRSDVDAVDEAIEITHWMPLPEPPKEAQK